MELSKLSQGRPPHPLAPFYFARTIPLDTFLRMFADSGDPLIRAPEDALIHEPRRDGMMGLRDRLWQARYRQPVERLLHELARGSAGEVPSERVYPRITLWGLTLGAALLLWTSRATGTFEHLNLAHVHAWRGGLDALTLCSRSGGGGSSEVALRALFQKRDGGSDFTLKALRGPPPRTSRVY